MITSLLFDNSAYAQENIQRTENSAPHHESRDGQRFSTIDLSSIDSSEEERQEGSQEIWEEEKIPLLPRKKICGWIRETIRQMGKNPVKVILWTGGLGAIVIGGAFLYQYTSLGTETIANNGYHGHSGFPVLCPLPSKYYHEDSIFPVTVWFNNVSNAKFQELLNYVQYNELNYANFNASRPLPQYQGYGYTYRIDAYDGFSPPDNNFYEKHGCGVFDDWRLIKSTLSDYYSFIEKITQCPASFLKKLADPVLQGAPGDPLTLTCQRHKDDSLSNCCATAWSKNLTQGDSYCPADLCIHAIKGTMPFWDANLTIYTAILAPISFIFVYAYFLNIFLA